MSDLIESTDRLYKAIGQVIVDFQLIEYTLSEILAGLLHFKESEDNHRVSAAMSYRQKVGLVSDIYDKRKPDNWPSVDIRVARKALFAAEDFRNRVVHSFWHVASDDENETKWMRVKASLRTSNGLKVGAGEANIEYLEASEKSLKDVRDWYLGLTDKVQEATEKLKKYAEELHVEGTYKSSI